MEATLLKFNWACEQFDRLWKDVTDYIKTDPCRFVADPETAFEHDGQTWVSGNFVADDAALARFSLQFGDIIANFRASFDYLVWELVLANENTPSNSNAFPICDTIQSFQSELKRGRLTGIDPAAVSIVEEKQPYHGGNRCHEHFFWVLHELANINKHRRILTTAVQTAVPPDDLKIDQLADGSTFAVVNPPITTQFNTKAGPYRVVEREVQVDHNLLAYIAIKDTEAKGFEMLSFIDKMREFFIQELVTFKRFF